MLRYLEEYFAGQRAKIHVVSSFLRLGIRVDDKGNLFCDNIALAPVKVGRAFGVDRRVVIETAKDIAGDKNLALIFANLSPIVNVSKAAKLLGHDVIEINADPHSVGVVAKVSAVLAKNHVPIRQIIADDPDLYPNPKLSVVVNGKLPQKAFSELRALRLKSISFK